MFKRKCKVPTLELVFFDALTTERKRVKYLKLIHRRRKKLVELVQQHPSLMSNEAFQVPKLDGNFRSYRAFAQSIGDLGLVVFIKHTPIALISAYTIGSLNTVNRMHISPGHEHPLLPKVLEWCVRLLECAEADAMLKACCLEHSFILTHPRNLDTNQET